MANYCDFNPRLFKPFTSMRTRVKPQMASDWVMVPDTYNKQGGFRLESEKTGQEIADIDLYRFLRFCKEQSLMIDSLKLVGRFIVGNDRSVYTEEMYNKWRSKFDTRTETVISKKDAKVGHKYKTPCGKSIIYLGARYVSSIKFKEDSMDLNEYTKVTRIHFVADDLDPGWNGDYGIERMKNKITVDEGLVADQETVDKMFDAYLRKNPQYVCFEKKRPKKNFKIGLVEIPLVYKGQRRSYVYGIVAKANGEYWCGSGRNSNSWSSGGDGHQLYAEYKDDNKAWMGNAYCTFDPDTLNMKENRYQYRGQGYYGHHNVANKKRVEKMYRLGIVSD